MDGIAAGVRKSWVEMCSSSCCLERGGKGGWFKVKSIIIFALLCTVYLASSMNEIWLSRSRPIDDDDINYLKDVTLREVGGALLLLIIIVFDGPAIVWSWVSFILPSKNIVKDTLSFVIIIFIFLFSIGSQQAFDSYGASFNLQFKDLEFPLMGVHYSHPPKLLLHSP